MRFQFLTASLYENLSSRHSQESIDHLLNESVLDKETTYLTEDWARYNYKKVESDSVVNVDKIKQ